MNVASMLLGHYRGYYRVFSLPFLITVSVYRLFLEKYSFDLVYQHDAGKSKSYFCPYFVNIVQEIIALLVSMINIFLFPSLLLFVLIF